MDATVESGAGMQGVVYTGMCPRRACVMECLARPAHPFIHTLYLRSASEQAQGRFPSSLGYVPSAISLHIAHFIPIPLNYTAYSNMLYGRIRASRDAPTRKMPAASLPLASPFKRLSGLDEPLLLVARITTS